jgi:hypothetical protein
MVEILQRLPWNGEPKEFSGFFRLKKNRRLARQQEEVPVMLPERPPLAVWTNLHDNGWMTTAVESPDGTFFAWATPDETLRVVVDYIEDGAENAMRAAEFALRRKSGHTTCSTRCTGWLLHEGAGD